MGSAANMSLFGFDNFYLCLVVSVTAAIHDGVTGKIPNFISYPAILFALAGWSVAAGWSGLGISAGGLVFASFPFLLAFIFGGCGGGDVKIMAAAGALMGFAGVLPVLAHALAAGALMALFLLIIRGRLRGFITLNAMRLTAARLGHFDVAGIAVEQGDEPVAMAADRLGIRFGIALAAAILWLAVPGLPHLPGL